MAKTGEPQADPAISEISVAGLKSIGNRQSIEIRPLTILAGANSSGKSSMMQGLLLLKQTLEATYDPGPLLIRGPNVAFSSVDQMLCRTSDKTENNSLEIGLSRDDGPQINLGFFATRDRSKGPVGLSFQRYGHSAEAEQLSNDVDEMTLIKQVLKSNPFAKEMIENASLKVTPQLSASRCFFSVKLSYLDATVNFIPLLNHSPGRYFIPQIEATIHLPGLRGNPERTYPITAVGEKFPGTFEHYAASVIADWTRNSDERLQTLGDQLAYLGLTWKVESRSVDDTQVELRVGRLPKSKKGGAKDLVSIADVGLGVSQTLPVLVSLLVAKPGQLVYIEQPEIHLHPRAQFALAKVAIDAANRGVRAVIETHSSLFLLGVQSMVAEGKLSPEKVKLHWFRRSDKTGTTTVQSADLDEAGRFGDWPEDFGDVSLEAEGRYLDAVQSRRIKGQ